MSEIGLLWDSVSENVGDKAIGLVLQRALSARSIAWRTIDPFAPSLDDLACLIIGGGDIMREPHHPYYDAFRVEGRHILSTVGVVNGTQTEYLKDYRLVSSRSTVDQDRLGGVGEIVPCLTLLYDEYLPANATHITIPDGAIGIHFTFPYYKEARKVAEWLQRESPAPIVWIPITHYNADYLMLEALSRHVPGSTMLPVLPPDAVYQAIGQLAGMITTSLHGTLFAYSQNVPLLATPRSTKIGYFLADRGLDQHTFMTGEDIIARMSSLLTMRRENLYPQRDQDRRICAEWIDGMVIASQEAIEETARRPVSISMAGTSRQAYDGEMLLYRFLGEYAAEIIDQSKSATEGASLVESEAWARHDAETARQEAAALRSELTQLRASRGVKLLSRFVWPVLHKLRGRARASAAHGAAEQLLCTLDEQAAKPVIVGKGALVPVHGWCIDSDKERRRLEIVVDGIAYPIYFDKWLRTDVFDYAFPALDPNGNSLFSGFWGSIPIAPIEQTKQVQIALRATYPKNRIRETALGAITLIPDKKSQPAAEAANQDSTPLIAICMATYKPPLDLLRIQIESLREQTHRNWVCIINDDGSPAETVAAIKALIAEDERFRFYRNEANIGFYHNFETALTRVPANAAYIALCDQDDRWYPDKLACLLNEFREDTTLVYSDMDIVSASGDLISPTYWTTRKNNYTDFSALLLANTITGAASLFRADLLDEVLPFPQRIGEMFHDHWIACVAMAKGQIGYVNRALYAYRQHSTNVLGHYAPEPIRPLNVGKLFRWVTNPALGRQELKALLIRLSATYPIDIARLTLMVKTLQMRLTSTAPNRAKILRRFSKFDRSGWLLFMEAIRYVLHRRPTLGIEWYFLRGAVLHGLFRLAYRLKRRAIMRERLAGLQIRSLTTAAAPAAPESSVGSSKPASASPTLDFITQKVTPLQLSIRDDAPSRVNMLIPMIDFRYLFGGYIGKFQLALRLVEAGYKVRLVLVDPTDVNLPAWRRDLEHYPDFADLLDKIEISYHFDRLIPLEVSPADCFIATTWWTAHIAHRASQELGKARFVYLIQEYEPMTFPMGVLYALADETYTLPHDALFSTEFLRDYFRQMRYGVFAEGLEAGEMGSRAFENAIHKFAPDLSAPRREKKLLYYARPEPHASRNMFELGVMALNGLIESDQLDLGDWQFHGIGSIGSYKPIPLARGCELKMMPRVGLDEYHNLLPTYDVGLSLMLTPHPSLTPLEMSGAGLLTVTNTYANKTADKLAALSDNLIAVPPTVAGIRDGLIEAARGVDDLARRRAGSQVRWATTWEEALHPALIEWLTGRIDRISDPDVVEQAAPH